MPKIVFNRLIFLFFLNLPLLCLPQGEWKNWYFGWGAAMTFNLGNPVALSGSYMNMAPDGTSITVSDSSGNFLFCSNGREVFDINNWWMQNDNGLLGGNKCQQPVFCVQNIGNPSRYYLFTVGEPNSSTLPFTITGLHYSVIDMTLNGGSGAVVAGMKNISIPTGDSAVDQLTGIRHRNNSDVWVVVRKHGFTTRYLSYLVTTTGINLTPVVSSSNLPSRIYFDNGVQKMKRGGDLKISQDGTKLVCSDSLTEICDFLTCPF